MSRSKYINTFYTEDDFRAYIKSDLPEFPNIAYQKYLDNVEITMTKPAVPVWSGELSDDLAEGFPSITLDNVENRPGIDQDITIFAIISWSNAAPTTITINNKKSIKTIENFNIDTSNVTSMASMFNGCSSLTSVNLTKFNTSNVTSMSLMFSGCSSLTSLDLTKFNTSNVLSMSQMFSGCSSLTSLDLSNFNTSKVTNMSSMFRDCSSLTSLDLSNFDTSKISSMNYMFQNCSSLTSLNLYNWNISTTSSFPRMFNNCTSLTDVYINNEETLLSLTSDNSQAGDTSNEYRYIPGTATIHFNSDPEDPEMIENYVWSGSSWGPE